MNNTDYTKLFDGIFIIGGLAVAITSLCNMAADRMDAPWLRAVGFCAVLLAGIVFGYYKLRQVSKNRNQPARAILHAAYRKAFRPKHFGKVHAAAVAFGVVFGIVLGGALHPLGGTSLVNPGAAVGIIIFVPLMLLMVGTAQRSAQGK